MKNMRKVEKNLKKVFRFYSTQQSLLGKSPTFASIEQNLSSLSKGKFLKFCLDFSVKMKQEELFVLFSQVTGFQKEMNFNQFLAALEKIRGNQESEEFYGKMGMVSEKEALGKCKPFSKKNGTSLPQLPPLVQQRPRLLGVETAKQISSSSHLTKSTFERFRSRNASSLPSAAVVVPMSEGRSYHSRYGNKVNKLKHWDEINNLDSNRVLLIYGDLGLNELITTNKSDDDELEKFGY